MYSTTDAIVLSLQPHSDKAHVLHAYTRAGGRVNYMVYGLGRKNAAGKYTPLSIVELTTDERSVRTAQLEFVPHSTVSDPYKRAIALFISEVLFHVLRHPMQDEPLYDFITQAITELDSTSEPQNFHFAFSIRFCCQIRICHAGNRYASAYHACRTTKTTVSTMPIFRRTCRDMAKSAFFGCVNGGF